MLTTTAKSHGLKPGATLRDLADDDAEAVNRQIGEPVNLIGVSTGGSVAG